MKPERQRIAIAEACGWKLNEKRFASGLGFRYEHGNASAWSGGGCYGWGFAYTKDGAADHLPNYLNDLNAMHEAEKSIGLHDRSNLELRVRWINALRFVVSKDCPKNKVGTPIVSDVDLLNATASQCAEAFLRAIGKWENE